jgi:hypothetical protein
VRDKTLDVVEALDGVVHVCKASERTEKRGRLGRKVGCVYGDPRIR